MCELMMEKNKAKKKLNVFLYFLCELRYWWKIYCEIGYKCDYEINIKPFVQIIKEGKNSIKEEKNKFVN